jgi:hypothetical protein
LALRCSDRYAAEQQRSRHTLVALELLADSLCFVRGPKERLNLRIPRNAQAIQSGPGFGYPNRCPGPILVRILAIHRFPFHFSHGAVCFFSKHCAALE